jgi:hypothetical protein
MSRLPTSYDAPRSIDTAIPQYSSKPAGRLHAAIADPNLIIILAFCAIGLLVTLNLIFGFPSFVPSTEQMTQFLG